MNFMELLLIGALTVTIGGFCAYFGAAMGALTVLQVIDLRMDRNDHDLIELGHGMLELAKLVGDVDQRVQRLEAPVKRQEVKGADQ